MFLFTGYLWTNPFRDIVREITDFTVDTYFWSRCKFGIYLLYASVAISPSFLVIISIEKFIALYFPLQAKTFCNKGIAKRVSLVTMLIVLLYNVQFFMVAEPIHVFDIDTCTLDFSQYEFIGLFYTTIYPILTSYSPFAIITVMNSLITYKFVMAKCKAKLGSSESSSLALSKASTQGTVMAVSVSCAFIILTAPNFIANHIYDEYVPYLVRIIVRVFLDMNYGINAVIYCITGSRFRKELLGLFKCWRKVHK